MTDQYDHIYLTSACKHLKNKISNHQAQINRYNTGEIDVSIPQDIAHTKVLLISSMADHVLSPHDHLIETMLTLKALRPAKHVTLYLIYGAYTRHDDKGAWMYSLLSLADHIVILEPHKPPSPHIQTVSMNAIFSHDIQKRFHFMPIIVSPDQGGTERANKLACLLNTEYITLTKERKNNTITITQHWGDISLVHNRPCLVIDDIIDSGNTLVAAHNYLHKQQPQSIHAYATHALMGTQTTQNIQKYYNSITVTNSVNQYFFNEYVRVIDVLTPLKQS